MIVPRNKEDKAAILELHSLHVKLYKHQAPHQVPQQPITTVAGVTGGIANFAMSKYLYFISKCTSNAVRSVCSWQHMPTLPAVK